MRQVIFSRLLAAGALILLAAQAQGASVSPGAAFSVTFDSDIETAPLTATGAQLGGGACDYFDSTFACDAQVEGAGGFFYGFTWNDADRFTVALTDPSFANGPSDLAVSATVALPNGVSITSIAPAPSSLFLDFLNSPSNPTSPIFDPTFPAIAFTNGAPGSATIDLDFAGIDPFWWPDGGYFLGFDVTLEDSAGPAVIPLPATVWLLGAAMLGLVAGRRRA